MVPCHRRANFADVFQQQGGDTSYAAALMDGGLHPLSAVLPLACAGSVPGSYSVPRPSAYPHEDPDEFSRSLSSGPSLYATGKETCAHVRLGERVGGRGRGEKWRYFHRRNPQ